MKNVGLALTLAVMLALTGCVGDVYVTSTTVIASKPSRTQKMFPRGELVFACTTMAALYDYLDNYSPGYHLPLGCRLVEMTAARFREVDRGIYDSYRHGRVKIYQFQVGWYIYYTFRQRGYHPHLY